MGLKFILIATTRIHIMDIWSIAPTWVHLSVVGNTIGVNDVLKSLRELVKLEVSRRHIMRLHFV